MARPRVFVSSTYYDLKHIRASLEVFIESLGFDAVLFEKGDIAFHPDRPLDESCYREAAAADIFVLIIGGRYGTATSSSNRNKNPEFFNKYESITRKEFETAQNADIPTFILVDSSVAAEYQTYLRNRDNNKISYAHVDSIGVFKLLESIFERSRNNPVFHFDRATQIEAWLREQWSGLFCELLRGRSQQKQLSALNAQVLELKTVNETLKTYLEEVLNKVNPAQSDEIIKHEKHRLKIELDTIALKSNKFYQYCAERLNVSHEEILNIIISPNTADEAIEILDQYMPNENASLSVLRRFRGAQRDYNIAREILSKFPLDFSNHFHKDSDNSNFKSEGNAIKESSKTKSRKKSQTRHQKNDKT